MPGRSNDTGYPPEVGKHAHTPKFPATHAMFRQMKGADRPNDFIAPIIHDDRNPDTEEPFIPIFGWILSQSASLLDAIARSANDAAYRVAVEDFNNFVEFINNKDPAAAAPVPCGGRPAYNWARVGPTISEAAIEPVFSAGNLKGAIVTVTWLGGTHTSSSSTSVP